MHIGKGKSRTNLDINLNKTTPTGKNSFLLKILLSFSVFLAYNVHFVVIFSWFFFLFGRILSG